MSTEKSPNIYIYLIKTQVEIRVFGDLNKRIVDLVLFGNLYNRLNENCLETLIENSMKIVWKLR